MHPLSTWFRSRKRCTRVHSTHELELDPVRPLALFGKTNLDYLLKYGLKLEIHGKTSRQRKSTKVNQNQPKSTKSQPPYFWMYHVFRPSATQKSTKLNRKSTSFLQKKHENHRKYKNFAEKTGISQKSLENHRKVRKSHKTQKNT